MQLVVNLVGHVVEREQALRLASGYGPQRREREQQLGLLPARRGSAARHGAAPLQQAEGDSGVVLTLVALTLR